jgi:Cof subfamily protein (haloacid dehalogenase superfamily)
LPIRLVALDIDGTLLDSSGHIPGDNVDALRRASAAGVEIVLATGRRFDFARPIFEQLPGPLTLIVSNGAVIRASTGEVLVKHLLPTAVARSILQAFPEHRERAALLFDRPLAGQIVYERVNWDHPLHRRFFRANRPFISEIAPLEDALTEDPIQLMFTGGCAEMRATFETLQCCAPDTHGEPFSVALTEYVRHDFSLVDVIRAGCSKGAALQEWATRRGLSAAEVMAIGDNLNDLPMLEFAGHPIVMGNGLDELKARGWQVTRSNDEAGVAHALNQILEGEKGVLTP